MTISELREALEDYGDDVEIAIRLNLGHTNEHAFSIPECDLQLSSRPDTGDSVFYLEISNEDRIY